MGLSKNNISKKNDIFFFSIFFLIALIASYLRVFQIETRPLHSDEAVNFLFVEQTNSSGYYPYSHENYHGPLFFYIVTGLVNQFGDSIFALRAAAIFAGIFCLVSLFGFIPTARKSFILFSAALVAFSPSLIFFSRYAIHETQLVLATLIFALSIYNWHLLRKPFWLYLAGLSLCLMMVTKETFIISAFALFCSFLLLGDYKNVLKDLLQQKIHLFFSALITIFLTAYIYSAGFKWYPGLLEFFQAFPQWFARNHTDTGHQKPFIYYLKGVILESEIAIPFILSIAIILYIILFSISLVKREKVKLFLKGSSPLFMFFGVWTIIILLVYFYIKSLKISEPIEPYLPLIFSQIIILFLLLFSTPFVKTEKIKLFFKSCDPLLLFLGAWTIITFLVYSFVKYKTAWLIINITFPAQLFMAKFFSGIFELPRKSTKLISLIGLSAVIFFQTENALKFNFAELPLPGTDILLSKSIPYGPGNPFSYVHTAPGTLSVVNDLQAYLEKKPNAKILVGIEGYFPIPYYLRHFQKRIAYTTNFNLEDALSRYDVLVLDYYRHNLLRPEFDKKYYRLSDYKESFTYFRKID